MALLVQDFINQPSLEIDSFSDYLFIIQQTGQKKVTIHDLLIYLNQSGTANAISPIDDGVYTQDGLQLTAVEGIIYVSSTNGASRDGQFKVGTIKANSIKQNETYKLIGCSNTAGPSTFNLSANCLAGNWICNGITSEAITATQDEANEVAVYLNYKAEAFIGQEELISPVFTQNLYAVYQDYAAYTGKTGKLNQDVHELLVDYLNYKEQINSDIENVSEISVQYVKQEKTDEEKQTALSNIWPSCSVVPDENNSVDIICGTW